MSLDLLTKITPGYSEYIIAIPIAILFPFFFRQVTDVVSNRTAIQKKCNNLQYYLDNDYYKML